MPGGNEGASERKPPPSAQTPLVCSQEPGPSLRSSPRQGPPPHPRPPGGRIDGTRHPPSPESGSDAVAPLCGEGDPLGKHLLPSLHLPATRAPGWLKGPRRGAARRAGGRSLWASAREGGRWGTARGGRSRSPGLTSGGGSDPRPCGCGKGGQEPRGRGAEDREPGQGAEAPRRPQGRFTRRQALRRGEGGERGSASRWGPGGAVP